MKNLSKIIRHTFLYLALVFGYLYLYVVDIDQIMYPEKEIDVKSKIDFVYQQF